MEADEEKNNRFDLVVDSSIQASGYFSDWMDKLEATFNDMDLKYKDGESSNEAMNRIVEVVNEIVESNSENTIIVAHGGIISLLLSH